jgi:NADH-quinone oxidoreductase subunit J
MQPLILFIQIAIYTAMVTAVIAAIKVVTFRNLFHSALALAYVLVGMAGIFIALRADFLAMVQILIYVGAVMTLVIFTIMLTQRLDDKSLHQNNRQSPIAFLAILVFLIFMIRVILKTPWPVKAQTLEYPVTTPELGEALLGVYVFPFEVISVILIAVLIGAIIIAKRDPQ